MTVQKRPKFYKRGIQFGPIQQPPLRPNPKVPLSDLMVFIVQTDAGQDIIILTRLAGPFRGLKSGDRRL